MSAANTSHEVPATAGTRHEVPATAGTKLVIDNGSDAV